MKNLTEEFKNYRLIHNFRHEGPLKAWVNEGNFNNIYKEDWNALMEVVEKIEELGFIVEISKFTTEIDVLNEKLEILNLVSIRENNSEESTKIKKTYRAVVKFIKWYNNQKK